MSALAQGRLSMAGCWYGRAPISAPPIAQNHGARNQRRDFSSAPAICYSLCALSPGVAMVAAARLLRCSPSAIRVNCPAA